MKKWLILGVGIVVVLAGLALARQWAVDNMVQRLLSEQLGADVEVEEMSSNWRTSTITLKGLRVRNPEGFPSGAAIEINRLHIRYKLLSLFTRNVELPEVHLDIQRVVAVTDERGQTNLEQLGRKAEPATPTSSHESAATPSTAPDAPQPVAKPATERPPRPKRTMHIEQLAFRLGEVEMRDHSRGGPEPLVRQYRLNLERTFHNVRDLEDVAQAVGVDLALAMGPQLIGDLLRESNVSTSDIEETIRTHEGDLEDLGRKLDEQTKDLQRELRRQLRSIRDQAQ